jgi:hypothetical protein
MLFDIITGKGLNNNIRTGDRQAAFRQTPSEHEELLDERNLPGYREAIMLQGPARLMAIQQLRAQAALREAEYPKYWDDQYPRRDIAQSSSWVGDIDYDPYSNAMQVQLGNKVYTYSKTPEQIAEIINSPNIGEYFNGR